MVNLYLDGQRVKGFFKSTNLNLRIHNTFYNSKKHYQIHLRIITKKKQDLESQSAYFFENQVPEEKEDKID